LTAICRATNSQRYALRGGSHVAASPSPFCWLSQPCTANRFSGSLAKIRRSSGPRWNMPVCHAFDSETT
jgi:hypothetical protein